jgi:hypothetical protein
METADESSAKNVPPCFALGYIRDDVNEPASFAVGSTVDHTAVT